MRLILSIFLSVLAGPALAHIGHLGEVAGHGHWIALGGIAIAAGIAWLGGRKEAEDVQDDDADEIEEEEATA